MKVIRQKQIRKILRFFALSYGLHTPYKVIVDGSFLHACAKNNVDLEVVLKKLLMAEVKLFTAPFVITELKKLEANGAPVAEALKLAKELLRLKLGANKNTVDVVDGFSQLLSGSNRGKYIICTQDPELRSILRNIPGTPIIYLNRAVLVLEQPSKASKSQQEQIEIKKSAPTRDERRLLQSSLAEAAKERKLQQRGNTLLGDSRDGLTLPQHRNDTDVTDCIENGQPGGIPSTKTIHPSRKKRKGPKEPNPLSMRKSKKAKIIVHGAKKKKNRRRTRKKKKEKVSGN